MAPAHTQAPCVLFVGRFTQISTSKQKRFPLITFVDTPGLVDGDMSYGEGFDQSLLWLGNLAGGHAVVGPWCFPRQCCSAALFSCPAVLSVAWHLTRQHDTRLILLFVVVRRRHVGSEPAKLDFPNLPASAPPHSIQHNSQLTLILYGTGATTASFSSTRSDRLSASTLLTLSRR